MTDDDGNQYTEHHAFMAEKEALKAVLRKTEDPLLRRKIKKELRQDDIRPRVEEIVIQQCPVEVGHHKRAELLRDPKIRQIVDWLVLEVINGQQAIDRTLIKQFTAELASPRPRAFVRDGVILDGDAARDFLEAGLRWATISYQRKDAMKRTLLSRGRSLH